MLSIAYTNYLKSFQVTLKIKPKQSDNEEMNQRYKKIISYYFIGTLGFILGLVFPAIFIFLDLRELSLPFSFANTYDVFKSQHIYAFSSVLFPMLFTTIAILFWNSYNQNKKLAQQELYVKSVLNSLTDCILVCNSSGKIQYVNQTFNTIYNNILSIKDLLPNINLTNSEYGKSFESKLVNKNEETRSISYTVNTLVTNNSSLLEMANSTLIISIKDIEELKKNEETIELQKFQLFESSKLSALGEMAAGFAHEINNPLTIINGKLSVTKRIVSKDEVDKEMAIRNIEACLEAVKRISKIITGLKNLSHSDTNEFESILIKDLIEDPIVMANLKIHGKGIEFRIDVTSVENELIRCNRVQISQVLINLLNNSIYEIESNVNPWISLKIESNESGFKFIVMDCGTGIPLKGQEKIFNPMFTTKPIGIGTGLGLSISKSIIEKHQGTLLINNKCPNTCFEITIPKIVKEKLAA